MPLALVLSGANRTDMKKLEDLLDARLLRRAGGGRRAPVPGPGLRLRRRAGRRRSAHGYTPHIPPKASAAQPLPPPGHPDRHPPRRWVVEVGHSWFNRFRRLLIRWDKQAAHYLAFAQLAACLIIYRKLRHARLLSDRLVHLDGYNLLPHLTGQEPKSPRQGYFYFSDDGDLTALRFDNWKMIFLEQRATGTLRVWAEPFVPLRVPKIFNLRTDPYERADITSNTYYDWLLDHAYLLLPAQAIVAEFLATFKEFPPRQKAASFTIDQAMEKMSETAGGAGR